MGSGGTKRKLPISLGTCVGIISQPENRSVEEPDQPDISKALPLLRVISKPDRSEGASIAPLQ